MQVSQNAPKSKPTRMKSRITGLLTVLALSSSLSTTAQDLLGLRTSRYIGGASAIFNPANIADSRHKFSLNLVGLDVLVNNSFITFDQNSIKDLSNIQDLFKDANGPISAKISGGIVGPGVQVKLNQKSSIALNTRVRFITEVSQLDQELYRNVVLSEDELESGIKSINSPYRQAVNATGWGEIGLTYARTIYDKEAHFLKVGLTAKYLIPFANYSMQINQLNTTIVVDSDHNTAEMRNSSGTIGFEQSGADFDNIRVKDFFKTDNPSIGFDLGVVYEYRPKHQRYRNTENGQYNSPKEKYAFRLGVAVLDFGKMKFNRNAANSGTFDIDINGAEAYNLRELEDVEIPSGLMTHLRSRPQYFTERAVANPAVYTLNMPTNLNVDLDVRLLSWLYVNGAYQKFMDTENEHGQSLAMLDNFTITPRIELKKLGVYLPINHSELTGTNFGAALRFGGFYIGSSNALTLLTNGSKKVNVYTGLFIGLNSKR